MRNLSNCKITTFRLNSALLTALFSMRREIKRGGRYPRECICLQGVQLSQGVEMYQQQQKKNKRF